MQAARDKDVRWREGRVFSLVFNAGDEVNDVLKDAYSLFFSENGLSPMAFPSLRQFETEVVAMTPVGYPAAEGGTPKRKEISEFVFYEKYGKR